MSGTAISQLPVATAVVQSDLIPIVEVASTPYVTKRATVAQFLENALPASGGTLTGDLTISPGNLTVTGGNITIEGGSLLLDNSESIWWKNNAGVPQPVLTVDGNNDVVARLAGANFAVMSQAGTGYVATVDNSGNFSFAGLGYVGGTGIQYQYTGNHFGFGWNGLINMYVDGTYVGDVATTNWVAGNFKGAGSYTPNQSVDTTASPSFWNVTVGGTLYVPNAAAANWIGGSLNVSGTITSGSASMSSDTFQFSPNYFWGLSTSDGSLYYVTNGNLAVQIGVGLTFRIYSYDAYKPAGGPWIDPSDARIKTVLGDYTRGLDDILKLSPRRFRYLGNNEETKHATDREFVGFVAQEVETVWPSMVEQRDGEIDGQRVSDLRFVDTNELTYALINAVRQLEQRVAELEARGS